MKISRIFILLSASIFSILVVYRYQFFNSFTILSGDKYDSIISASILEHWYNFFCGKVVWYNVGYFYPYEKTIANTDAYFLLGVIYSSVRSFGIDAFLSQELTGIITRFIGFYGVFFLSRFFKLNFTYSILVAVLFSLSNGMASHINRIQILSVSFIPLIIIFFWKSLELLVQKNFLRSFIYIIAYSSLYGMLAMSCFYIAWFFLLFMIILMFIYAILERQAIHFIYKNLALFIKYISSSILSLILFMIPFIYTFYDKSQNVNLRVYDKVFENTISFFDLFQVGENNIFSGYFINSFLVNIFNMKKYSDGEYYNLGFAALIFLTFLMSLFFYIRINYKKYNYLNRILLAISIATVISILLILKIYNFSLWYYIFEYVPGAKALNVISIFLIVLTLPIYILAIKFVSEIMINRILLYTFFVFLVVEELNQPYMNLDRKLLVSFFEKFNITQSECNLFYVSGLDYLRDNKEWIPNFYEHNVYAMFLAEKFNIPTINGVASFNQKDWDFGYPNSNDYDDRIFKYLYKHNLTSNVCKLDLNDGSYSKVQL